MNATATNATEPVKVDPMAEAIKAFENKLTQEAKISENVLRNERLKLTRLKDKESESGKNGFFIVQAQVSEFQVGFSYRNISTISKYPNTLTLPLFSVLSIDLS